MEIKTSAFRCMEDLGTLSYQQQVAEVLLSASGEHMIVDPGGSEVLYGLPPKPIA
jgi:hypothetical protein